MIGENQTSVMEFFLLGFGNLHNFKVFFFVVFLIIYITAFTGNLLVIILVATNHILHSPMYFFLSQLSLSEILFTTNIIPNMLHLILKGGSNMPITNCMIQFYLLCVPTIAQSLLLAAMSFDRYAAICNPLHYMSIMTFKLQIRIAIYCWTSGVLTGLLAFAFLHPLVFCFANVINHFYCDIAPILELSCSDTSVVELTVSLTSTFVFLSPFVFIIGTYISILRTILRIPSKCGRKKAFSTCSTHLSVVCVYYGTMTAIYLYSPGQHSLNVNKFLSLLYIVVTPLFNPIIYSLRNKDIKRAIQNSVNYWKGSLFT
ncbi:olfactory receptor 10C1-like [Xenopus laevis]|uniref:Olfactory receptor 10C1-like n=2 Tax=Xenopus laevis TaxID=8355 RepID=A0A1L8H3Z2_XENLA|nr:olfactory receptor 10C1-like [Xenopus laevis]OCT90731.1 hypothetical protein XELAEV_18019348mg [Xenopus laevis]